MLVNGVRIYQFKTTDYEINVCPPLCLGNTSKDFTVENMKKSRLYESVYDFSVNYNSIDVGDILDIHKHLIKKHNIKYLDFLKIYVYCFIKFLVDN